MKITEDPTLPALGTTNYSDQLRWQVDKLFRDIALQVNRLTEGSIYAVHNSATAAPTAGKYQQGDFIRNSQPSEAGSAASKYVVYGWLCTVAGEPGTWVQCRFLTGN
jgi:hypothetical protein